MERCDDFRARLAVLLSGRSAPPDWTALSWHEHLLGCADCRALLEAEEALDVLLETLPEPRLPRALCERVLQRLTAEREGAAGLDRLLELARVAPPDDLAERVLHGLRDPRRRATEAERQRALDRLLDRPGEPRVPAGLAERVLEGLEPHRDRRSLPRTASGGPRRMQPTPRPTLRWAAAAAVLLAAAFGIRWAAQAPTADVERDVELAGAPRDALPATAPPANPGVEETDEPSEELLASLELLESWDLLMDDDVDAVLASLDPIDEMVLYLDDEELGG